MAYVYVLGGVVYLGFFLQGKGLISARFYVIIYMTYGYVTNLNKYFKIKRIVMWVKLSLLL